MLNAPADLAALLERLNAYEHGSMRTVTMPDGARFALDDRAGPELIARIEAAGGTVSGPITLIGD